MLSNKSIPQLLQDMNSKIEQIQNNLTINNDINITGTIKLNGKSTVQLIETYSNGYNWYRVWSDGWCEQGGSVFYEGVYTITFLKPFKNTYYQVVSGEIDTDTNTAPEVLCFYNKQRTSVIIYKVTVGGRYYATENMWRACGYI